MYFAVVYAPGLFRKLRIFWKPAGHVTGVLAPAQSPKLISSYVHYLIRAWHTTTCCQSTCCQSTQHRLIVLCGSGGGRVCTMFRATSRLLQCRITFFTRSSCGLCDTAKSVVQGVNAKRPLEYREINVMEPGQEKWKSVYEFDTPVVCHQPTHICSIAKEYLSDQTDPH